MIREIQTLGRLGPAFSKLLCCTAPIVAPCYRYSCRHHDVRFGLYTDMPTRSMLEVNKHDLEHINSTSSTINGLLPYVKRNKILTCQQNSSKRVFVLIRSHCYNKRQTCIGKTLSQCLCKCYRRVFCVCWWKSRA